MLDMQTPDRRRSTRFRRHLLVQDRTGIGRTARPSIDLCQDGMRLAVQSEHLLGKIVELDVHLGDGRGPLRVRGEVVSAQGGEAGIRFVGLGIRDRVRLVEALVGE